jgi:hypothetical protein
MTISEHSRVIPAPNVLLTRAGDEGVLVDEGRGSVHVVNATAARVWELCDGGTTFEGLIDAMTIEYRVSASEIRPDLESVLETFCDLQLVSVSSPA